jgi:hypothetical protein
MQSTFTDDEKIALFNKIEALYFDKNFGSTSKADLELLLFSVYIEHCINKGEPYDDYTLSKSLGITQARIRSLKEKKELKYPRDEFKWEDAFAKAVETAKYDDNDHYVKIIIQDINVMNEVRHFIEQKGWYDECSLNKKLLKIPLNCFVEICSKDNGLNELFSEEAKHNINKLELEESALVDFMKDFSKDGLKTFLMKGSKETICTVLKALPLPASGALSVAFSLLVKAMEKS